MQAGGTFGKIREKTIHEGEVMVERDRYRAEIAGKNYTLVGSYSKEHLDGAVQLVNLQLEQLAQLAPDLSTEDLAILMAVNAISDQMIKEKRIMDLENQLELSQMSQSNRDRTNGAFPKEN